MALSERHRTWIFSTFLICFVTYCSCGSMKCFPGIEGKGYTVPHGDIILEGGIDSLNITCILDDDAAEESGPNASQKMFFYKGAMRLPREMVQVVDSKSIRLYVEDPPIGPHVNYDCMIENEPGRPDVICNNFVFVGRKPQEITDFECIGYNHENLTCTWSKQKNYVHTEYSLAFKLQGRFSPNYSCPKIETIDHDRKMMCVWTPSTNPIYRQVHKVYTFYLTAKNVFGEVHYNQTFNHFRHVLSGPPVNLSVLGVTTNSILLSWSVPHSMQTFPCGVHHRILYQCEYGDGKWRLGALITDKKHVNQITYNLTVEAHPHIYCDIRVSIRTAEAHYLDESMWSRNTSRTVRLASTIPAKPPLTNMGSYELQSSGNNINYRMVYIYWQQIPIEDHNGPDFRYYVTVDEDLSMQPSEMTHSFAKFDRILISNNYTFNVWSRNANGTSVKYSVVRVPSHLARVAPPRSFTKIEYEDSLFELSWERPKLREHEVLTNYTIFWCDSERDRPHQCSGKLDWRIVPANLSAYNLTLEKKPIYQFAISSNTYTSSSGMLWASCTVIYNKKTNKMQNVWISRVGSTFIELGWKLDCSERFGPVEAYMIHYCPIIGPHKSECKPGSQKNQRVNGSSSLTKALVENLKPYTTYMLTIAVITKHSNESQQHSDPLLNTTLEAAPSSPPMNFTYYDVTDSSVLLQWGPPLAENGKLKFFVIEYNNKTIEYDPPDNYTLPFKYELKNLTSYENYSISIKACTIQCSGYSKPLKVTTMMGYPGVIEQPSTTFQNNSLILISWKSPNPPRGRIDFYEVQIKQKRQGTNVTLPIVNVTANYYAIEDCGEKGDYNSFYIAVRAVNIISGKQFPGPWSDTFESYCQTSTSFLIYVIIFVCAVALGVLIYVSRKGYARCREMIDVQVKLPPGLATVIASDQLTPWSSEKINDDQDHSPAADEEMLLTKISEVRHQSGESSGCSSAQGSVTGSIKSTSHLSGCSDSGTEHPRSTSVENLQSTNSLRLRNVPSRPTTPGKGYVTMPTDAMSQLPWSPKETPAGNYCVLGIDPATNKPSLNVSDTDFGTDLSLSASTEDLKNSLRLRSAARPQTNNKGYVVMPPETLSPPLWSPKPMAMPTPMPTPAGNYCVLGVDPSSTTKTDIEVDKPYVPITSSMDHTKVSCDAPTQSTPYVLAGELINKSVNPGYVPHKM